MSDKKRKKGSGGSRTGAGRKPILDKKLTISIHPRKSRVKLIGLDEIKDIAHTSIEREYLKRQKII